MKDPLGPIRRQFIPSSLKGYCFLYKQLKSHNVTLFQLSDGMLELYQVALYETSSKGIKDDVFCETLDLE